MVVNQTINRNCVLAIVIPYFKIDFFEETLKSLAVQTRQDFNVYIGDDRSPNDPSYILRKFQNSLNIIYQRFPDNFGTKSLVAHWDRCIEMTDGEDWIMLLGDDDILGHNVVESFYMNFSSFEDKANVVRFSSMMIDEKGETKSMIFRHPHWEPAQDFWFRRMKGETRSSLSEHIFLKDIYNKYGFHNFPLAWHTDDRAWLEFSGNKPIFAINRAVVKIRISSHSISGSALNNYQKKEASIEFYRYIMSTWLFKLKKEYRFFVIKAYNLNVKKLRKPTKEEQLYVFFNYLKYGKKHFLHLLVHKLRKGLRMNCC